MILHDLDPLEIIRSEAHAMAQCFGIAAPDEAADSLVERLQSRLAGVSIYIPARSAQERRHMHAAIRAAYNGRNAATLAREWGITPRGIRKILRGAAQAERI